MNQAKNFISNLTLCMLVNLLSTERNTKIQNSIAKKEERYQTNLFNYRSLAT